MKQISIIYKILIITHIVFRIGYIRSYTNQLASIYKIGPLY